MRSGLTAALIVVCGACAHPAPSEIANPPVMSPTGGHTDPAPGQPSLSSRQVCDPNDGQQDISRALAVTPTAVTPPTWTDHLYSCRYVYPDGSFSLSVKELTDDAATGAYLDGIATRMGRREPLDGIGEGAFWTANGSIAARKDDKVLLVDVSGLPAQFARPPQPPIEISRVVATVIMGCWAGG